MVVPHFEWERAERLLSLIEVATAVLEHRTSDHRRFSLIDIHVCIERLWDQRRPRAPIMVTASAMLVPQDHEP